MSLADKITTIVCFNPPCSNKIIITIDQKKNFLISFTKKYDSTVLPSCCRTCQGEIAKLLGEESEFDELSGTIPGAGSQREKALKKKKSPRLKTADRLDDAVKAVKSVVEMGEVVTWVIIRDRLEEAGFTGKIIDLRHLVEWGQNHLTPKPLEQMGKSIRHKIAPVITNKKNQTVKVPHTHPSNTVKRVE